MIQERAWWALDPLTRVRISPTRAAREEQTTEEPREEETEAITEEPETKPVRVASKKKYICGACGNLLVPKVIDTKRGDRYQCPNCKKLIKLLTPEHSKG